MDIDLASVKGEGFSFWKNLTLMIVFFTIAPVTIAISIFSLLTFNKTEPKELAHSLKNGVKVYASLPSEFPTVSGEFTIADARAEIVKQYLERYNSPLSNYADYLVNKADEHGLDYRLLPAIAQQESNLCKFIPAGGHNCWGWGIHSEGTLGFSSFEEAIDTVSWGLKKDYIDKGLTTPDTIWTKYTPSSPDGAWAKGVNTFMAEME